MAETQDTNPNLLKAVLKEADRIEEDTLYSAKGQWETARDFERLHLALGIPATIAAAVAGVAAVTEYKVLTIILAVLTAILTGLLTFLDPKARANIHRNAGNAYKELSNDARIFREVTCFDAGAVTRLREMLEELNRRRNSLNSKSPQPSRRAFKRARKGIVGGEAAYRADAPTKS
jgi:hypothetical protein